MLNKIVYNNCITLKNATIAKKNCIDVNYNLLFLIFLKIFYSKGYILGYVFNDYKSVRVYLKYYYDKGLFNGLRFCKFKPNFSFKSLKYIRKFNSFENSLYFLSTSKGFFTLNELFSSNFNIGGILYFYLIYN